MVYIVEMFKVIQYVHSLNVAMRNIGPHSFQFSDDSNEAILYLTHYENSRVVQDSEDSLYGNINGKLVMMSPELCNIIKSRLSKGKWEQNISGQKWKASDLWSLGVLTFYMIVGKHPFLKRRSKSHKISKTVNAILNHRGFDFKQQGVEPFKFEKANEIFEDFMNKILCNDYTKRMNIDQCLNHEFLSKEFQNNLDEKQIKPEILTVLKQNNIQSKLHGAI